MSRPDLATVRLPDPGPAGEKASRSRSPSPRGVGAWGEVSPNHPPSWAPAAPYFPRRPLPSQEAENDGAGGGRHMRGLAIGWPVSRRGTPRVVSESEGARAGGRSLCVRSPRSAGVSGRCRGPGRARGWDGMGCLRLSDRCPGAPELASKKQAAGHHTSDRRGPVLRAWAFAVGAAYLDRMRTVARRDKELPWLLNF